VVSWVREALLGRIVAVSPLSACLAFGAKLALAEL
jgi:hypothetical protein